MKMLMLNNPVKLYILYNVKKWEGLAWVRQNSTWEEPLLTNGIGLPGISLEIVFPCNATETQNCDHWPGVSFLFVKVYPVSWCVQYCDSCSTQSLRNRVQCLIRAIVTHSPDWLTFAGGCQVKLNAGRKFKWVSSNLTASTKPGEYTANKKTPGYLWVRLTLQLNKNLLQYQYNVGHGNKHCRLQVRELWKKTSVIETMRKNSSPCLQWMLCGIKRLPQHTHCTLSVWLDTAVVGSNPVVQLFFLTLHPPHEYMQLFFLTLHTPHEYMQLFFLTLHTPHECIKDCKHQVAQRFLPACANELDCSAPPTADTYTLWVALSGVAKVMSEKVLWRNEAKSSFNSWTAAMAVKTSWFISPILTLLNLFFIF